MHIEKNDKLFIEISAWYKILKFLGFWFTEALWQSIKGGNRNFIFDIDDVLSSSVVQEMIFRRMIFKEIFESESEVLIQPLL